MKYIVYCTICTENQYIYIGVHQTNDDLKFDFYLGCGCYSNKPSSYFYPKTKFLFAVKTYGPKKFKRLTLAVFDNEDDAYLLESILVNDKFLARKDVYNQVLGGRVGILGINSIPCYQYDLNGVFLKKYNSILQASITVNRNRSVIQTAIRNKIKSANYFWSLEKVAKLDLNEYKTTNNKVPVFLYSNKGEYECCYESISDAARIIGSGTSNICRGIKLGYLVKDKYFSYILEKNFSIAKHKFLKMIPIYLYSLDGKFIKRFNSLTEAIKAIGKNIEIYKAIKLGRTAAGFLWSYEKLPNMPNILKIHAKARKVGRYLTNGKLIEVYNTVTECTKHFSGCKKVLNGEYKTSGGYIFKYIDN